MKDGNYWIYDKQRYGWEVVRVIEGVCYRFGIELGLPAEDLAINYDFIRIETPQMQG